MRSIPAIVTPPSENLLTLDEVKDHCRVDGNDHDDVLSSLILAAQSHLDGYAGTLGRALISQEWSIECEAWGVVRLPLDPFIEITSIEYTDMDGTKQTVADSVYKVDVRVTGVYLGGRASASWPTSRDGDEPITITWRAGYGAKDDVPDAIRQAALLLVGHWFENREAVIVGTIASPLPFAVDALLAPHRRAVI